jgi:RNA recognition motif-containing protein
MRSFFSTFGKVVDATVMVDRETGRSKGFGFVTFEDNSNESQLVGKLGLVLDDKQVRVSPLVVGAASTNYLTDRGEDGTAAVPA